MFDTFDFISTEKLKFSRFIAKKPTSQIATYFLIEPISLNSYQFRSILLGRNHPLLVNVILTLTFHFIHALAPFSFLKRPHFMKRRRTSSFEDGRIIEMLNQGKKLKEIHNDLGIPMSTLCMKRKRYLERNTLEPLPRSGRPRITTEREDRMVLRESQKDPFKPSQQIAIDIGRADVSPNTIRRRLLTLGGLHCRVASKKPLLSRKNRIARFKWALDHRNWTLDQWKSILWSDESKFCIRNHGSRNVYRPNGQRFNPKYTQKTVKHDKSIMVWGCFSYNGIGKLYRIHRIMDSAVYHMILRSQMFPSARDLFGESPWIFQQDNDPKHTSRLIKSYLERKNVNVLQWPSQSPDLNPIENLWSRLEWNLKTRNCNNEDHLMEILQDGWDHIDQDYMKKLIESMPNRCRAVIKARGRNTKY